MAQQINIILAVSEGNYIFYEIDKTKNRNENTSSLNKITSRNLSSSRIGCEKCKSCLEINLFCSNNSEYLKDPENFNVPGESEQSLLEEDSCHSGSTSTRNADGSSDVPDKEVTNYKESDHEEDYFSVKSNRITATEIDQYLALVTLPENLVLPDLYKIKAPYSKLHDQPDGTKIYVKKGRREFQVMNFDPRCQKCDLCGKTHLNGRNTLINHRKDEHLFPDKTNTCMGCHITYETEELKLIHSYFCLKKYTIQVNYCNECSYQAPNYSIYRKHLREKHDDEGVRTDFVCHECSAAFEYKKQLYAHILTHQDPLPYKCNHCDAEFKAKQGIWSHLVKAHFHQCAREICKNCTPPVHFSHKHLYQNHLNAIHLKHKRVREACSVCGKLVKRLKLHMKEIHADRKNSKTKKFECRVCQKIFFSNTSLKSHQAVHKTDEELRWKCPHCVRGFDRHSFLLNHIRSHTGEKPFKCDVCDKSYARKNSLIFHQREHTGERIDCPICHIQIVDPRNFTRHLKHHENQLGIKLTLNREEWRLSRLNIITTEEALRGNVE